MSAPPANETADEHTAAQPQPKPLTVETRRAQRKTCKNDKLHAGRRVQKSVILSFVIDHFVIGHLSFVKGLLRVCGWVVGPRTEVPPAKARAAGQTEQQSHG